MMTESTLSAVTPLASNAALFVRTDISVAVRSFILPPNAPNGVLLAATMKAALLTRAILGKPHLLTSPEHEHKKGRFYFGDG